MTFVWRMEWSMSRGYRKLMVKTHVMVDHFAEHTTPFTCAHLDGEWK